MDMNWIRSAMTVIWWLIFIGVVWWAFSPRRKAQFEDAAQLVFDGETPDDQPSNDKPSAIREP